MVTRRMYSSSPDDSQLFVTFPYGNSVSIIDTLTNTVAFGFSVSAPRGIAFNSKGREPMSRVPMQPIRLLVPEP